MNLLEFTASQKKFEPNDFYDLFGEDKSNYEFDIDNEIFFKPLHVFVYADKFYVAVYKGKHGIIYATEIESVDYWNNNLTDLLGYIYQFYLHQKQT